MKKRVLILLLFVAASSGYISGMVASPANSDPWTAQQLLDPAELARVLNNPKAKQPVIYSIGMEPIIKGSIDIGPVMMKGNLDLLKQKLQKLPKNTEVVIYCGCCPFSRCPNIRPAMQLMKDMQFTNYKLLNLPDNIKVDWIDKNYPVSD